MARKTWVAATAQAHNPPPRDCWRGANLRDTALRRVVEAPLKGPA